MNEKRLLVADVLIQAAVFMLLCTVMLPLASWVAGGGRLYLVYLLALPFFLTMLFRRLFTSLASFILLHAALLASVYVWPVGAYLKILLAIFMAVSVIYSFADRLSRDGKSLTLAFLALSAALNIGAGLITPALELDVPVSYYMTNFFIVALCYFLYRHITDVAFSLEAISLTSSQPVATIKKYNNAAIVIFMALASVAALLSRFIPVGALLRAAGNLFIAFLRFLYGLAGESEVTEEPQPMPSPGGQDDLGMLGPPSEPFILWVILEKIILFIFYAATVIGIVGGIIYLCYKLYKSFYSKKSENADVREFVPPEAVYERIAARFGGAVPFLIAPSQRIRRLFYRKVRKHMKAGLAVEASQTAREIAAEINKKENIDELTTLYENARYNP